MERSGDDHADLRKLIKSYIACRQWTGVTMVDVESWLDNFTTNQGRLFGCRILANLLYYSEEDLEILLREGLFHVVLSQDVLLREQLATGFRLKQADLRANLRDELGSTIIVRESGNNGVASILNRIEQLKKNLKLVGDLVRYPHDVHRLIIVDDYVRVGDDLKRFWTRPSVGDPNVNQISLREWCREFNITPYYLVLVGFQQQASVLKADLPDLRVICMQTLTDQHRVFSGQGSFWRDPEQMREAKEYLENLALQKGLDLTFGDRPDLDYAVVLHQTIPEWSLALLWQGSPNWVPLQ